MSKIKLANDLKRLLPGQANSRIRQAILEAYQRATGAPSLNPEYYQSNITNIVQNVITEVVGVVAPDGILVYGGVEQDGNDLIFDTDWQWRRSGVAYKLIEETTTPIPPTDIGYTRTDIVVGTMAGTFIRVAGTPVELPTVAAPPTLPANTIPIISVDVSDIGITNFIEFALASFVRFDVNNQDLNPVQRQNARTNIQALSKDTNDSRTGQLTQNGKVLLNVGTESNGGVSISFPDTLCTFPNNNTAGLFMRGRPSNVLASYLVRLMSGENFQNFAIRNRGDVYFDTYITGSVWPGFSFARNGIPSLKFANQSDMDIGGSWKFFSRVTAANKSSLPQELVRRDELHTYYNMTVTDDGQLDNLVLNPDAKLLIFTNADDLTGIEMEANRKLKIFNNSGGTLTIHAESASSIAANRFATGTVIPDQGFQEIIKIGTRIRLA